MPTASRGASRRATISLGAALAAAGLLVAVEGAGAGGDDSAAVRGYIVPTPNNPDVNPATTCSSTFANNDTDDDQVQSQAGTSANAVTLAGCSYDALPFEGPSTEDRPVVFAVSSGQGGLLCGATVQQAPSCALPGINHAPGGEYRVLANSEAGVNPPGSLRVEFCADDPPVQGVCGVEDEQSTLYTIHWRTADGGGGGGGAARCAGKPATIEASSKTTKGTTKADVIVGRKGKDTIKAKGGNDLVCSKGGKDKVNAGGGKDKLKGGPAADRLNGGPGKDRCKGGPGNDKLKSCEKGGA